MNKWKSSSLGLLLGVLMSTCITIGNIMIATAPVYLIELGINFIVNICIYALVFTLLVTLYRRVTKT